MYDMSRRNFGLKAWIDVNPISFVAPQFVALPCVISPLRALAAMQGFFMTIEGFQKSRRPVLASMALLAIGESVSSYK